MPDASSLRRGWTAFVLGAAVLLGGQTPGMTQDPPKDPPTKKKPRRLVTGSPPCSCGALTGARRYQRAARVGDGRVRASGGG